MHCFAWRGIIYKNCCANVEQSDKLTRIMNCNNKPLSLNYALHCVITTDGAFFVWILQKISLHHAILDKGTFNLIYSHITWVLNYNGNLQLHKLRYSRIFMNKASSLCFAERHGGLGFSEANKHKVFHALMYSKVQ